MDGEFCGRKPAEGPHGEVVGATVVNGELLCEVIQGIKAVAGIEALLVLAVAALHLSVVARGVGADELMSDAQLGGSGLKQSRQLPPAVGKAVGELKAIVGLNAFHPDAPAGIPADQLFEEVGRGEGGLFGVGGEETQAGELIYGGVLEQAQVRIGDAAVRHHLYIHLDTLAGISHLLIGLGLVGWLLLCLRKQAQLPHDPEQALRAAGITSFPQSVPQLHHTEVRIATAQVPDQLQLRLCVLVGVVMRPPGLTGQGLHGPIPACFPEIDVRPALVILPAGTADAVFLRVFHQGLPICHVLCYTLAHEGYGPLSFSCCPQLQL